MYTVSPIISHTKKRIQVRIGKPDISSRQNSTLRIGAASPPGARKPRWRSDRNRESNYQPHEEANPGEDRQARHQQQAEQHTKNRGRQPARRAETAVAFRSEP